MAFRFVTLVVAVSVLYGGVLQKLYRLQVEQGDGFTERAKARQEFIADRELRRGEIFFTDRDGKNIAVALNRDFPFVFASPSDVVDSLGTAQLLAPIVGWDEEKLAAVLSNTTGKFYPILDKATAEQVEAIDALDLHGVFVSFNQYRSYPFGSLGSQLVGFVGVNETNPDPVGLYGIEKRENETLAAGVDVRTTIDWNLQIHAEQVLSSLLEKYSATGGTVIIQEPSTGKIFALASKPDFDPNTYSRFPLSSFINPSLQYIYEPGSVMKTITMAAGIDAGAFSSSTTYVDTGSVTLNRKTITNYDGKAYGKVSMTNVLERSINTGAVFAEQQVGHDQFYNYLKRFGFGTKTGITLVPDELSGSIKNLESRDARAIDFATASFGQGIAMTPLQLVTAYSAVANGGRLMAPYLDRNEIPRLVRTVISAETAADVTRMLESTVSNAKVAVIAGYRVAGKTGTAFIADSLKAGYTEDMIHNYVGFAPASNPRFTILVKLDRPSVGELAGLTVVPAFRELMQFALNHYSVPPDNVTETSP